LHFTNPVPTLTIFGAIAVDPISNLVLTLNFGSGTLTGFTLGNIKPVHIEGVLTPAIDGATVGTPASLSPAAKITLGAAPQPVGSCENSWLWFQCYSRASSAGWH